MSITKQVNLEWHLWCSKFEGPRGLEDVIVFARISLSLFSDFMQKCSRIRNLILFMEKMFTKNLTYSCWENFSFGSNGSCTNNSFLKSKNTRFFVVSGIFQFGIVSKTGQVRRRLAGGESKKFSVYFDECSIVHRYFGEFFFGRKIPQSIPCVKSRCHHVRSVIFGKKRLLSIKTSGYSRCHHVRCLILFKFHLVHRFLRSVNETIRPNRTKSVLQYSAIETTYTWSVRELKKNQRRESGGWNVGLSDVEVTQLRNDFLFPGKRAYPKIAPATT